MCRILAISAATPFSIAEQLLAFASVAENSREYQGHGWGCAWRENGEWRQYHNVKPIWEDETRDLGDTKLLLVHARSAFRDEGIRVENNMPFGDERWQFIFNGELRGVRIKEEGRIGAEKIFNYVKRFEDRGPREMLETGTRIINKRTRYVRAMNILMSDGATLLCSSHWSEDPDYFQMHQTVTDGRTIVCSDPLPFGVPKGTEWTAIPNGVTFTVGTDPEAA